MAVTSTPGAPATAPETPAPETPAAPVDDAVLVQDAPGAAPDRLSAALAAWNAARETTPTAGGVAGGTDAPDAPDAPAKDGETPAPAPPEGESPPATPPPAAAEAQLAEVLKRLTASEQRALDHDQRVKAAEAKAAEYEALFRNAEDDPAALFERIKWSPEKVREYAEHGRKALTPELAKVSAKSTELETKIAQLETALAQQRAERLVTDYKAELRAEYTGAADKYPHLSAIHDGDPAKVTEQIYQTIETAYQGGKGKLLTMHEAAALIDEHWRGIADKLAGKTKSAPSDAPKANGHGKANGAVTTAQPTKPSAANAKPTATQSLEDEDVRSPDDRRFDAMVHAYRAARRETQT